MKTIVLIALVSMPIALTGQVTDYQPYFSAVVVRNIDVSVTWYKAVFNLTTKDVINDPNNAYKITILESPAFVVELMQLKGSLPHDELVKGKPGGTEIQGHFKIGFKVADMDRCLNQLASLKVKVPQVWADPKTKKRNFLVKDPDGNLVQFFE